MENSSDGSALGEGVGMIVGPIVGIGLGLGLATGSTPWWMILVVSIFISMLCFPLGFSRPLRSERMAVYLGIGAFVGTLWLSFWAYDFVVNRPIEQRRAAVDAMADGAVEQLPAVFKEWRAVTQEAGAAIDWSGAASEVLWTQRLASRRWLVWAKSPNGRIFTVAFVLAGDPPELMDDESPPALVTKEQLLEALIKGERTDLVDKLDFQRKPA